MIEFSADFNTYVCPFCGCKQTFEGRFDKISAANALVDALNGSYVSEDVRIDLYILRCINMQCLEATIIAWNVVKKKQYDIFPHVDCKHFPNYIPKQIVSDYEEGSAVLQESPKAAATLFRRCLQGMIRDFWGVKDETLNKEIAKLKDRVSPIQWKAMDGLRKIGNIGAHMEKDVNLIIDVEPEEAEKLKKLIELLLKQWYVDRHEEEQLCEEITKTAEEKNELIKK